MMDIIERLKKAFNRCEACEKYYLNYFPISPMAFMYYDSVNERYEHYHAFWRKAKDRIGREIFTRSLNARRPN